MFSENQYRNNCKTFICVFLKPQNARSVLNANSNKSYPTPVFFIFYVNCIFYFLFII